MKSGRCRCSSSSTRTCPITSTPSPCNTRFLIPLAVAAKDVLTYQRINMTTHSDERYYVPHGSHWPIVGSIGLLFLMVGVSSWLNGADAGFYIMLAGLAVIIFMLTGWFGTVIGESQAGLYNARSTSPSGRACSGSSFPRSCSSPHSLARCSTRATCRFPGSAATAITSSPTCCCGKATRAPGRPTARATSAVSTRRCRRSACR